MTKPIIKIDHVEKDFELGDNIIRALQDVNAEICAGEFTVIYGPSGCGKTTLLGLIAGLDTPSKGSIIVRDENIHLLSQNELAKYRRTKIGMVFQQFNLIQTLSARDNVALPLLLSGLDQKSAHRRASELLDVVGLRDRLKHKPSELSGGQQQRVAIARALAANPRILLIDEPTGNLDEKAGDEVMDIIKMVNAKWGRTIILVTHNPEFLKHADHILFMKDGQIIKEQRVKNVDVDEDNFNHPGLRYFVAKKAGSLRIGEILRLSRLHFFSKRLRTVLTTLGVALGLGSIMTLVSFGIGLQSITSNQLASLDSLVTINVSVGRNSTRELDDNAYKELAKLPDVSMVSPTLTLSTKITYGEATLDLIAYGIKKEALAFEGVNLVGGQAFASDDEIILTKDVLKNFGIADPNSVIGKKMKLNFLVIPKGGRDLAGIHEYEVERTVTGVSNDDMFSFVYMPLDQTLSIADSAVYTSMKVKVNNRKNVVTVRDQIEKEGYKTTSVVDLINRVDKIFFIAEVVLGVIGGVALLVALIGILNIMTISLLERTHEIGIMKAIGATNHDIGRIFEYEVFLFGLTGSLAGVAGAWFFGELINNIIAYLMRLSAIPGSLRIFITPYYFAVEMIILTILVSLLAGIYPSKRASRLSPIEALRYE